MDIWRHERGVLIDFPLLEVRLTALRRKRITRIVVLCAKISSSSVSLFSLGVICQVCSGVISLVTDGVTACYVSTGRVLKEETVYIWRKLLRYESAWTCSPVFFLGKVIGRCLFITVKIRE